MKKNNGVTQVVAIAIGAAIMFILMKFVVIPLPIPNTTLQVSYGFLALFAAVFGPVPAALAGFIGHWLNDALTYGSVWYSWVIASAILGLLLGVLFRNIPVEKGIFERSHKIQFLVGQLIANGIVWAVIAPVLDILIYSEPASKVFTQGIVSAVLNAIATGLVGWLLIEGYARTRTKSGSLSEK